MEYKKKLKQRLLIHLGWAVFGLIMILIYFLTDPEHSYQLTLGITLILVGITRTLQYRKTMKDEKALRQQELAEKDERNRMMDERAKSWAFSFHISVCGAAVFLLSMLGYHDIAVPIAFSMCVQIVIYWISWNILRKKY